VWDLGGLGEGLRNTIELNGRAGLGHGALHWSANFDEVQDFENQIRGLSAGTGLIASGTPHPPMGTPNAGRSADLDALAAYVASLGDFPDSPYRNDDGSLTTTGIAGREVFVANNCASCHSGTDFTDSATGLRHDVGTIKASSGSRLGGLLDGLDTPTLRGLWEGAPFLHDGSADTLADAVAAHDGVSLTVGEMSNLVAYLRQIDSAEVAAPVPATPQITTFASDPWGVPTGGSVTLSWDITNGGAPLTALQIDGGIGSVLGLSEVTINVDATTTFTLSASTSSGESEAQVTVIVGPPPGSGNYPLTWPQWQAGGWGDGLGALPGDDTDRDGRVALLEFANGESDVDGRATGAGFRLEVVGGVIDAVLIRPVGIEGLTYTVETSAGGEVWNDVVSTGVIDLGDGREELRFADLPGLSGLSTAAGRARLKVVGEAVEVRSEEHAWYHLDLHEGHQTIGAPLLRGQVFSGEVTAIGASSMRFSGADLTGLLGGDGGYYAEVVSGAALGHRFDIDPATTAGEVLGIAIGAAANTAASLPAEVVGARIIVRPHVSIGGLLAGGGALDGGRDPAFSDQVQIFTAGAYTGYFLLDAGAPFQYWTSISSNLLENADSAPVVPGQGFFLRRVGAAPVRLLFVGGVRQNAFMQRLDTGFNLIASGYPGAANLFDMGLLFANGFVGGLDPAAADQVQVWAADVPGGAGYDGYFLVDAGPGSDLRRWVSIADSDLNDVGGVSLFAAGRAAFVRINGGALVYRYDPE